MEKHLTNAINYIKDETKTQNGTLLGAINCDTDFAIDQMIRTKKKYGKTDKRQGYHIVLSFEQGEITPETALEVMGKFSERYLGYDYEGVYAVHDNTAHVHGHLIFNSVSCTTGRKFRYEKGDWLRYIRPIVNDLCKEYGLSAIHINPETLEESRKKNWDKGKHVSVPYHAQISMDIEECIYFATDYDNFLSLLALKGYEVSNDPVDSIRPMGMQKLISLEKFSPHYCRSMIEQRIETAAYRNFGRKENPAPRIILAKGNFRTAKKYYRSLPAYQKKFFYKMYRSGQLKKKPYSQMWKYKEDIKRFGQLQEEYLYLYQNKITKKEELAERKEVLSFKQASIADERKSIYQRRYPLKPAFRLLDIINKNESKASFYTQGSLYYAPNYNEWKAASEELVAMGFSAEQVKTISADFKYELKKVTEKKKILNKELNLINRMLQETSYPQKQKVQEQQHQKQQRQKQPRHPTKVHSPVNQNKETKAHKPEKSKS